MDSTALSDLLDGAYAAAVAGDDDRRVNTVAALAAKPWNERLATELTEVRQAFANASGVASDHRAATTIEDWLETLTGVGPELPTAYLRPRAPARQMTRTS
jgi:hypothetical protein